MSLLSGLAVAAPKLGSVSDDIGRLVGNSADDIGRLNLNPFKFVTDWVGNNRKAAMALSALVDLTSYEVNNPLILNHLINQAKPAIMRTSANIAKAQAPASNIINNIIA
jgi:hypothetical protein